MKNPERPTAPPMATKIGYTCERKRVWSVDRFIHSRVTAPRTRRDGTTERRNEGRNERTKPSPGRSLSVSLTTNGRSARVRSRGTLLLDPFTREDATNDGRRTTTHLWAKPTLSERHVESKRVFVLWRVSRDARPVVPRAASRRVRSSPRRGREGVHLGSRIGES